MKKEKQESERFFNALSLTLNGVQYFRDELSKYKKKEQYQDMLQKIQDIFWVQEKFKEANILRLKTLVQETRLFLEGKLLILQKDADAFKKLRNHFLFSTLDSLKNEYVHMGNQSQDIPLFKIGRVDFKENIDVLWITGKKNMPVESFIHNFREEAWKTSKSIQWAKFKAIGGIPFDSDPEIQDNTIDETETLLKVIGERQFQEKTYSRDLEATKSQSRDKDKIRITGLQRAYSITTEELIERFRSGTYIPNNPNEWEDFSLYTGIYFGERKFFSTMRDREIFITDSKKAKIINFIFQENGKHLIEVSSTNNRKEKISFKDAQAKLKNGEWRPVNCSEWEEFSKSTEIFFDKRSIFKYMKDHSFEDEFGQKHTIVKMKSHSSNIAETVITTTQGKEFLFLTVLKNLKSGKYQPTDPSRWEEFSKHSGIQFLNLPDDIKFDVLDGRAKEKISMLSDLISMKRIEIKSTDSDGKEIVLELIETKIVHGNPVLILKKPDGTTYEKKLRNISIQLGL